MSRNNPREADTRRADTLKKVVCGFVPLINTPRQKEDFMSLLLPRIPDGTPADKQGDAIEDIKTTIRIKADHRLRELYLARKESGALESEADLVAGASAMLQLLNEITFSPPKDEVYEIYDNKLGLCPPAWFFLIYSGRGLGELYDDTTKHDEILEEVHREEMKL